MTTYHARLNAPLGRRSLEDVAAELDALPGDFTRGPVGDVQGQTATVLVSFEAQDEVDAERTLGRLASQLSGATAHLVETAE
jgi:hypothetical protein